MNRYARQMMVPGYGEEGQSLLSQASILVIGAGGLAASALPALVGAGVGRIVLVDSDTVSLSNLHRQTLFSEADIGASKVLVARQRMEQLNAEVQVEAHLQRFDPENGLALLDGVDLVLDCADSFACSYTASDVCHASGVPLISASIVGLSGYVGGFCGAEPSLRAVFPDLPDQLGSCDADGVLGPSVGVMGALQAQMALAVLTRQTPSPLGQLLTFDARDMRFSSFRFSDATEPQSSIPFIAPSQIQPGDFVVDLRGTTEPGPPITSDLRMPVADIPADLAQRIANRRAVFACRSGLRAWQAATKLNHPRPDAIALIALGG